MGNSVAYPVLRTTDATSAYTRAVRLRGLLAKCDGEVLLMADLRTVADVRRMAAVLPEAHFDYAGLRAGPTGERLRFDLDVTAADDTTLERHLPPHVMADVTPGSVEEPFVRALGRGVATVERVGLWPDEQESSLYRIKKYDGVHVIFHGDHNDWGEGAEHHTVFVHVGEAGDLPRVRKLAAYIGSEVLGEPQIGW